MQALFHDLLGSEPTPGALTLFVGAIDGGVPRAQVALALALSTEYKSDMVTSLYESYLGRQPSAAELAAFVQLASTDTDEQLEATILTSNEYLADAEGTPVGFALRLDCQLFDRSPTQHARDVPVLDRAASAAREQLSPDSVRLRNCVVLAAEDVQRDVRLVTDDPAVMTRRNVEEVAGAHHDFTSAVHLRNCLAAEHQADMLDLTGGLARRSPDVLGPPPARLVCRPTQRHRTNRIELELPLLERPHLGRVVEVHERKVHRRSPLSQLLTKVPRPNSGRMKGSA